jgi:hypothetical protein
MLRSPRIASLTAFIGDLPVAMAAPGSQAAAVRIDAGRRIPDENLLIAEIRRNQR